MKRVKIPHGTGHVFVIPVLSQADTKLFKTSMTIAAGDAALRDTNKVIPWAVTNKAGSVINVVVATGLGFPAGMANVLRVTHQGAVCWWHLKFFSRNINQ